MRRSLASFRLTQYKDWFDDGSLRKSTTKTPRSLLSTQTRSASSPLVTSSRPLCETHINPSSSALSSARSVALSQTECHLMLLPSCTDESARPSAYGPFRSTRLAEVDLFLTVRNGGYTLAPLKNSARVCGEVRAKGCYRSEGFRSGAELTAKACLAGLTAAHTVSHFARCNGKANPPGNERSSSTRSPSKFPCRFPPDHLQPLFPRTHEKKKRETPEAHL